MPVHSVFHVVKLDSPDSFIDVTILGIKPLHGKFASVTSKLEDYIVVGKLLEQAITLHSQHNVDIKLMVR